MAAGTVDSFFAVPNVPTAGAQGAARLLGDSGVIVSSKSGVINRGVDGCDTVELQPPWQASLVRRTDVIGNRPYSTTNIKSMNVASLANDLAIAETAGLENVATLGCC